MNNKIFRLIFLLSVLSLVVASCIQKPDLPPKVVEAIAAETVKYYEANGPEGGLLKESAKLDIFWGSVLAEEDQYNEIICFSAEAAFVYQGGDYVIYYNGVVKKPEDSSGTWEIVEVSKAVWDKYECLGDYLYLYDPAEATAEGELEN